MTSNARVVDSDNKKVDAEACIKDQSKLGFKVLDV